MLYIYFRLSLDHTALKAHITAIHGFNTREISVWVPFACYRLMWLLAFPSFFFSFHDHRGTTKQNEKFITSFVRLNWFIIATHSFPLYLNISWLKRVCHKKTKAKAKERIFRWYDAACLRKPIIIQLKRVILFIHKPFFSVSDRFMYKHNEIKFFTQRQ